MLIVEDDAAIRDALVQIFLEEGYAVEAVENGASALEWLDRAADLPDIILCDVMMPVMNGLEFVERLRKDRRLQDIPLVLMTACRMPTRPVHITGVPMLKKPFAIETVLSVVEQHAARSCRQDA